MVAVFRHGREQSLLLALTLDAQTHNHIRALAGVLNGRGDGAASSSMRVGMSVGGAQSTTLRPSPSSRRCCFAQRGSASRRRRWQPSRPQTAQMLAHGQHVQQSLRRMLVHAVARVDDARADMLRQQRRRAAHRMADDDDVRAHLVEVTPVSMSVSPLATLDALAEIFAAAADIYLLASSKDMRVRVEFS